MIAHVVLVLENQCRRKRCTFQRGLKDPESQKRLPATLSEPEQGIPDSRPNLHYRACWQNRGTKREIARKLSVGFNYKRLVYCSLPGRLRKFWGLRAQN
eukprot:6492386-Amphidinium_carterae.3